MTARPADNVVWLSKPLTAPVPTQCPEHPGHWKLGDRCDVCWHVHIQARDDLIAAYAEAWADVKRLLNL